MNKYQNLTYNDNLGARVTDTFLSGKRPKVLFIPGGPGISGKYWDSFAQEFGDKANVDVGILVLPGHDQKSTCQSHSNFESALLEVNENLENLISTSVSPIHVVAHSFGAYLLYTLLNTNSEFNFKSVTLLNIPSEFSTKPEFQELLAKFGIRAPKEFSNEGDFTEYWHKIVPFYFVEPQLNYLKPLTEATTHYLTSRFFENNKPSKISEIRRLPGNLNLSNHNIHVIESELDLITPKNNSQTLKKDSALSKFHILKRAGHFPMIESPQQLSDILIKIFKGANTSI